MEQLDQQPAEDLQPTIPQAAQEKRARSLERVRSWADDPQTRYVAIATADLTGPPIQFCVVDSRGQVKENLFLHTTYPIHAEAQAIHGVSQADLEVLGLPFDLALEDIRRGLMGPAPIVLFHAEFARQAFTRTIATLNSLGLYTERLSPPFGYWQAAQPPLSDLLGAFNHTRGDFRYISLQEACEAAGLADKGLERAGTAIGNAQRLAKLVGHWRSGGGA